MVIFQRETEVSFCVTLVIITQILSQHAFKTACFLTRASYNCDTQVCSLRYIFTQKFSTRAGFCSTIHPLQSKGESDEPGETGDSGEYNVYSTFQSHEPDFDYLKSLEIEEKINKIRWLPQQNAAHFLLSTNGEMSVTWSMYRSCNSTRIKFLPYQLWKCVDFHTHYRFPAVCQSDAIFYHLDWRG